MIKTQLVWFVYFLVAFKGVERQVEILHITHRETWSMHMEQCRASLCDMIREGFAGVEMASALLTSDHILGCITRSIQHIMKKCNFFKYQIETYLHECE